MPQSIIPYEKTLPEIPGRCPWLRPESFLVKDPSSPTQWRVDESGRRKSDLLLVNRLREDVDRWRSENYPGASTVAVRLFQYWFEQEHENVPGFASPFRYHFCQREAIETLIYITEVLGNKDAKPLIEKYGDIVQKDLHSRSVEFQTTMSGQRQILRYFPGLDRPQVQDLPVERLRRYAFKMATGSGKTWVMAMAIVWSYFHKKMIAGSDLSTNFLVIAPNIIVFQRLEKDFGSNEIFHTLPLIPPEWPDPRFKVICRDDSAEPGAGGNVFLTNIHQLIETSQQDWAKINPVEKILGPKVKGDAASQSRSLQERIRDLKDLVLINDEAHHFHDDDQVWTKTLLKIHKRLPKGLSLWLDFSATPKDSTGLYFPWIVCDYPLAQAVEDRIVKGPIIVTKQDDPDYPTQDPDKLTKDNVVEKCKFWIRASIQRLRDHEKSYKKLGIRPVLFIVAEKSVLADAIGEYIRSKEFKFKHDEVLVIHTDEKGVITKKDLDELRDKAKEIDSQSSKIRVIVSVMMLQEGWDVRSVTVILGLRPFSSIREVLPEQTVGRGLRLMRGIGPDNSQTLEVFGTRPLLDLLRKNLEAEGVGYAVTNNKTPEPITIEAVKEKEQYDIAIPRTEPLIGRNYKKISSLDVANLKPITEFPELDDARITMLRMEFATTETEVHQVSIEAESLPIFEDLITTITNKALKVARLENCGIFHDAAIIVKRYLTSVCFGREVDLESENVRRHLSAYAMQEAIASYLGRAFGEIILEKREMELPRTWLKLSETKEFHWTRNLQNGPLSCKHTIFNFVATYNDYERKFAQFLDSAKDVTSFASLGTTEQGASNTPFRITYLKLSGATGFYHPDWIAVQKNGSKPIYWILETKGRIWPDTLIKDEATRDWCRRITFRTGQDWDYERINQKEFEVIQPRTLEELIRKVRQEKAVALPLTYLFGETEMKWLSEHKELLKQFAGKWIGMSGERIIGADQKLQRVLEMCTEQGIRKPFTMFIAESPEAELLGLSNRLADE